MAVMVTTLAGSWALTKAPLSLTAIAPATCRAIHVLAGWQATATGGRFLTATIRATYRATVLLAVLLALTILPAPSPIATISAMSRLTIMWAGSQAITTALFSPVIPPVRCGGRRAVTLAVLLATIKPIAR